MDTSSVITVATGIASILSPVIIQLSKKWIPSIGRPLYAGIVSTLLAIIAMLVSETVSGTWTIPGGTWAAAILIVYGASQGLYATVNTILGGKLSADGTVATTAVGVHDTREETK